MKRFRFGLAPLLRVKQQRERIAEARVAEARQVVDRCRAHLEKLHVALKEVADRLGGAVGTPLSVESWAGTFDQSGRLERAIRDADAELLLAEKALLAAIEVRTRIATEVEALEILREQHLDLHQQDVRRTEQEQLDEVVLRQWMQARRKGPPKA